jgi:transposase
MHRGDLTNDEWQRLEPLLPPQKPKTGRPAADHRRIINGMLWIARTGAPWRDLPERSGAIGTVSSRFPRWRQAGVWDRILAALQQQADAAGQLDWTMHVVDGTSVRAQQHAAGAGTLWVKGTQKLKHWGGAGVASPPTSICGPQVGANR